MSDWSAGYNVDLGYTYGYYREQDPAWMDLCALLRGVRPPSLAYEKRLRYLELGCGQGVSLCLIAACHPDKEFVGIDFNPQHVAHARQIANAAGLSNVRFVEADFAVLGRDWPPDLGEFHYASAHGIYTWIAPEVARGLVRCLEHGLAPGGLFYVSYNCLPGWISTLPIQHLLRLWQVREELPSPRALELGRQRLQTLLDLGIGMAGALPAMRPRLEMFPKQDIAYLTQEYLNDTWRPLWFDEIERELRPAKLRYVGTVASQDWYITSLLSSQAKALVEQFQDPVEQEVMLDVLANQGFRRDLWIRGQPPIWPAQQRELLLATRFVLLRRPSAREDGTSPFRFTCSLGEVSGKAEAYAPIYDALEASPKSLRDLAEAGGASSRPLGDLLQSLGLMLSVGHAAVHRRIPDPKLARALNQVLCEGALGGAPYRYQVATEISHVFHLSDTDMMLLALHRRAPKLSTSESLASSLVERLLVLGKGLKEGERLLTRREEMQPRALALTETFLSTTLPLLQKFGVFGG